MKQYRGYDITPLLRRINGGYGGCMPSRPVKILWKQLPGFKLKAHWQVASRGREYGLTESDMLPIHEWSKTTGCGIRASFDTWRFKTPEEITAFLLKWS
jgi:hypothetical protein